MGTLDGERDVEWVAQEHNASVMREEAVLAKDPVSFSGFMAGGAARERGEAGMKTEACRKPEGS